jgi:hypothetical protein
MSMAGLSGNNGAHLADTEALHRSVSSLCHCMTQNACQ